ncbi:hypothetical protein WJ972_06525 [Achromobacter insuavis]
MAAHPAQAVEQRGGGVGRHLEGIDAAGRIAALDAQLDEWGGAGHGVVS